MVWEGRPLESITEADLQSLISDGEPEDKTLEYKESLPPYGPQDKIEFAADVSSFANAAGGHLIYGIREKRDPEGKPSGIPEAPLGVGNVNMDETIRRLESVLQDRLDPRLTGVNFRPVTLESSSKVLIIRVPKSWAAPHAVKDERRRLFYLRGTARKDLMDVGELRTAFNLSETTYERIRNFRLDRIGKIISGETPVPLGDSAKRVLHLVPLTAFDLGTKFNASALEQFKDDLRPIPSAGRSRSESFRYNYDGVLGSYKPNSRGFYLAYQQLFRNGIIEAVDTTITRAHGDGEANRVNTLYMRTFEEELIGILPCYFRVQKGLGLEPPIVIMLTLLGVRGYTIPHTHFPSDDVPIERNELLIPDILVHEFAQDDQEAARALKDAFDVVWNAAGWPGSRYYDQNGNRNPRR